MNGRLANAGGSRREANGSAARAPNKEMTEIDQSLSAWLLTRAFHPAWMIAEASSKAMTSEDKG